MTTPHPSSVKSEPGGVFYSAENDNLTYTMIDDADMDRVAPTSASIDIEPPSPAPGDTPFELLQGYSAPAGPVYVNMGPHEHSDYANFPSPTNSALQAIVPISRASADTIRDHSTTVTFAPRPSQPNPHHHLTHQPHIRNRYPYVQRPSSGKVFSRSHGGRPSQEAASIGYRPVFRRSHFALRRQSIPKAPPIPRHLYPGYRPIYPSATTSGTTESEQSVDEDDEDQLPPRSKWVILRLVLFFFSIEFMYAIETALTVPILTALRVPESYFSMAWLISPVLGFFLQPIVGMWSDTCKCRWGRRRPFILALAFGVYIGVTLLLNSSDLGVLLGDPTAPGTTPIKAVILTAVGVTLLDFSADSADSPVRAYLIDSTNTHDQERGFNIHAILGGLGGGLGFVVGAIHWPWVATIVKDGGEFSIIYFTASLVFFICVISTLTSIREVPLTVSPRSESELENTQEDDDSTEIDVDEKRPLLSTSRTGGKSYNTSSKKVRGVSASFFQALNNQEGFVEIDPGTGAHIPHDHVERSSDGMLLDTMERSHQIVAASMRASDPSSSFPVPTQAFDAELIQKAKLVKLGLMRRPIVEESDEEKDKVTLKSMLISMVRMPTRLWKLMICQVIGWVGFFSTHMYFTEFMAVIVYGGHFEGGTEEESELYKQGVTMGCWGLFVYATTAAVYAFSLERWLADRFSLQTLYFFGYFCYACGCIVDYYIHNPAVNIAMCFTYGVMVVSLNTLPYHMLANFHADETYKNRDGSKRGIGLDCSLLNSCYFLGEFIVAASLSPLIDVTTANTCMLGGAVATLLGNLSMCFLFFLSKNNVSG